MITMLLNLHLTTKVNTIINQRDLKISKKTVLQCQ